MRKSSIVILSSLYIVSVFSGCADNNKDGILLKDPEVVASDSLPGGIETTWSCVYFGSYPTCEIVSDEFSAVDDYAVSDGDVICDPELYSELNAANWEDDEAAVKGEKYRRIRSENEQEDHREQHYNWNDDSYHYFRYEPIKWRVIETESNEAVLMADRQLDCAAYNETAKGVYWEDCTLRSFLNGFDGSFNSDGVSFAEKTQDSFFKTAFSESEQKSIVKSTVNNKDNYYFGTHCGEATEDYVYIFDEAEVFASEDAGHYGFTNSDGYADAARRFKPTLYAMAKGAWYSPVAGNEGNGFWFLRTNGYTTANVDYICDFGSVYNRGTYVTVSDAGVIPVIRVNTVSARLRSAGTVCSADIFKETEDGEADDVSTYDTPQSIEAGGEVLSEPVVVKDDSLSSGLKTTWSCVSFGSYPFSEITDGAFGAVADYAVDEGDVITDSELYKKLGSAEWSGNETEIDGVKYRRISAKDSFNPSFESGQYYKWNDENEYRYFRYDPIKWRIIEINGNEVMLVADRQLDCAPYNTESCDVQWESCTLRSFLNGYSAGQNISGEDHSSDPMLSFYGTAFSQSEKECIINGEVENPKNLNYYTDCGGTVNDKVFILSTDEVFGSSAARHGFYPGGGVDDPARRFRPSMYAKARGTWYSPVEGYKGNSFWYMRTNGYTLSNASYICDFGYIYSRGTDVSCNDSGVLPAIRVDISKADLIPAGKVSSK